MKELEPFLNKSVYLESLENGCLLEHIPEEFWSDKEILMRGIKNGTSHHLNIVTDYIPTITKLFYSDRDICLETVKVFSLGITDFDEKFINDREILSHAFKNWGSFDSTFPSFFIKSELINDIETLKILVDAKRHCDQSWVEYFKIPEAIEYLASVDSYSLRYFGLDNNQEFIKKMVPHNSSIAMEISKNLRHSRKFMKELLENDSNGELSILYSRVNLHQISYPADRRIFLHDESIHNLLYRNIVLGHDWIQLKIHKISMRNVDIEFCFV
jgi:hypothetical protein